MSGKLKLGWVRHGVTAWNQAGRIQGATDIPLSAEGERQALLLADRLRREPAVWDGVACSDLMRARRTAQLIAERLNLPLVGDARLRERSFGEAEGTTEEERVARWGSDWRGKVPGQETDAQVRTRGLAFVEEFTALHPGESWLIVTHGSFLAQMLQALGSGVDDTRIANLSLTILEREQDAWVPTLHNCTAHLGTV
ncbi:histidine phosphatase family protein [Cohnella sp. JJ-181]|uniref:histidine phosphatase family protein n=1 Tax=Cohnella rhizoplanae TaxID=2974897 RepID=UPI0022FF4EB7|nr:histidine phosphatase family protein [Cohnella sp. JJ-181]CAI6080963.1 Phosphoserine phosphatase 1 [Cohnella sp. JJ-181]